ncbi:hypothetical protein B0T19DRAFT_92416 [Cercophora scortea]|uniref:Uncharacterized protein n=1 Tax=Cercophora scortea TaxID=314031 RepID=A0AAE0IW27_9PEZI|nr:hypothetical protein B0T19DRAFT_92416 [Cercophora scortea]
MDLELYVFLRFPLPPRCSLRYSSTAGPGLASHQPRPLLLPPLARRRPSASAPCSNAQNNFTGLSATRQEWHWKSRGESRESPGSRQERRRASWYFPFPKRHAFPQANLGVTVRGGPTHTTCLSPCFKPAITAQAAPVLHASAPSTGDFAKTKSSTPRSHRCAKRGRGRPKNPKAPVRDYKNLIQLLPYPAATMEADPNDQGLDWTTAYSTSPLRGPLRRPLRMITDTTINPKEEMITDTPFFLTSGGNWTSTGNILVSKRYYFSYIYESFLSALGYCAINNISSHTLPSINPRGGFFKPIGKAPIHVWFPNGNIPPFWNSMSCPASPRRAFPLFWVERISRLPSGTTGRLNSTLRARSVTSDTLVFQKL